MNSQLHTLCVTEDIGRRIQDAAAVRVAPAGARKLAKRNAAGARNA